MAPKKQTVDTPAAAADAPPAIKESFADLLEESLGTDGKFEGRVVKGTVIAVDSEEVLIDVGLKS